MRETRSFPSRPRRWALFALLAAVILPASATLAMAADEPVVPTTPDATTPTTPAGPNLALPATAADIAWTIPDSFTEEERFTVKYSGPINGQATAHFAFLAAAPACPASPVSPTQTAGGTRVPVTAAAISPTAPLGAQTAGEWGTTIADSGPGHLCGWILPSPVGGPVVAAFDRPVNIANKPATLSVDLPAAARSGEYFTLRFSGTNGGSSRRVQILAEKDTGQSCMDMRKGPAGKRPIQTVVGIAKGAFTKTVKVRFKSKTAGRHLLCAQIVEIKDRNPEAVASTITEVGQTLRCDVAVNSMSQRVRDLATITRRRDAARVRLSAARKKVAPLRRKYSKQKKITSRRVASARKAVTKAKSKAGKRKASKRLAAVRRRESKRLTKVGKPYRAVNASVRRNERTYKQHKTGVKLLEQSISRTKKDVKKYCA